MCAADARARVSKRAQSARTPARPPVRSYAGQALKSLDKQRKDPKLKKQKKIRFRPGTREGVPFRGYDRITTSGAVHSPRLILLCWCPDAHVRTIMQPLPLRPGRSVYKV